MSVNHRFNSKELPMNRSITSNQLGIMSKIKIIILLFVLMVSLPGTIVIASDEDAEISNESNIDGVSITDIIGIISGFLNLGGTESNTSNESIVGVTDEITATVTPVMTLSEPSEATINDSVKIDDEEVNESDFIGLLIEQTEEINLQDELLMSSIDNSVDLVQIQSLGGTAFRAAEQARAKVYNLKVPSTMKDTKESYLYMLNSRLDWLKIITSASGQNINEKDPVPVQERKNYQKTFSAYNTSREIFNDKIALAVVKEANKEHF